MQPTCAAQPTWPPFSCLLPVPAHEAARWRAPPSRLATSCLVASLLDAPGDATTPLASLSLSLEPLALSLAPPPPLLSLPHAPERSPSPPTPFTGATATPSLPLCIPELRPDPVELHTRRTRPEEAAVDRSVVVFISGARRSPSSIRRCRGVPEPTQRLVRLPVSFSSLPLTPRT